MYITEYDATPTCVCVYPSVSLHRYIYMVTSMYRPCYLHRSRSWIGWTRADRCDSNRIGCIPHVHICMYAYIHIHMYACICLFLHVSKYVYLIASMYRTCYVRRSRSYIGSVCADR